jgi:hypothetical protein
MMSNLIDRFIKKPPVMFPLVALFHIVLLAYNIYDASSEHITSLYWLQPLWMLAYTIAWLFVCDMRRWAAYTYIAITTINMAVHFFVKDELYHSSLFLIDAVFAMIVMAYIKRFE